MSNQRGRSLDDILKMALSLWPELMTVIGAVYLLDLWYFQKCYKRLELIQNGNGISLFVSAMIGFSFLVALFPKLRPRKILITLLAGIWAGNLTLYYTIYEIKVAEQIKATMNSPSVFDDAYCAGKSKSSKASASSAAEDVQRSLAAAWSGKSSAAGERKKSSKSKVKKKKEPPVCTQRQISNANPIPENNLNDIPKVEPFMNYRARLWRYMIHDWKKSLSQYLDFESISNRWDELVNLELILRFNHRVHVPKFVMMIDDDFKEAKVTVENLLVLLHLKSPLYSKQAQPGVDQSKTLSSDEIKFVRENVNCEKAGVNPDLIRIQKENEYNCRVEKEFEAFLSSMPRLYQRERMDLSDEDFADQKGKLIKDNERLCVKNIQVICFSSRIQNPNENIFKLSVPKKVIAESMFERISKGIRSWIPLEMFRYSESSIVVAQRASRVIDLNDLYRVSLDLSENSATAADSNQNFDLVSIFWPNSADNEFWKKEDRLSPFQNRNLTGTKIIGAFKRSSVLRPILSPPEVEEDSNEVK